MSASTPSQLLVRTGNVTSSAAGIVRKGLPNSQRELLSALRENFKAAIAEATFSTKREVEDSNVVDPRTWTESVNGVLTVPAKSPYSGKLTEGREGYEVTGRSPPLRVPWGEGRRAFSKQGIC
jgi:hypothetical protein